MPIYQYECQQCSHRMEALQRMSDDPLTDCPECNTPSLKKQLTAAAFKLKGTGWYETDFKNSGKKPEQKTSTTPDKKVEQTSSQAKVADKAVASSASDAS